MAPPSRATSRVCRLPLASSWPLPRGSAPALGAWDGGSVKSLACPAGYVVTGLYGAASLQVEQIGFQCRKLDRADGPPTELEAPEVAEAKCSLDGHCAEGKVCAMGQCQPPAGLCHEDAECGAGLACVAFDEAWGTCAPDPAALPEDARCDSACEAATACLEGAEAAGCASWCRYVVQQEVGGEALDAWAACEADAEGQCGGACDEASEAWHSEAAAALGGEAPSVDADEDDDDDGGSLWGGWGSDDAAAPSGGCNSAGSGNQGSNGALPMALLLLAMAAILRSRRT